MDMNSCVMGIERFLAQEITRVLWSDNGTIFIATERQLSLCIPSWNQKLIASLNGFISERRIL